MSLTGSRLVRDSGRRVCAVHKAADEPKLPVSESKSSAANGQERTDKVLPQLDKLEHES